MPIMTAEWLIANSIMAVEAGAEHVQGTYRLCERCGNANLSTIIPNLQIKKERRIAFRRIS